MDRDCVVAGVSDFPYEREEVRALYEGRVPVLSGERVDERDVMASGTPSIEDWRLGCMTPLRSASSSPSDSRLLAACASGVGKSGMIESDLSLLGDEMGSTSLAMGKTGRRCSRSGRGLR